MNKILNINLGGYALTIDDDAFEYLNAYLDSLRKRFSESEGRDEIVHDIESRLGELISQNMGNRSIVMLPDAEAAVEIMGKPEEFGGETATPSSGGGGGSSTGSGRAKSAASSTVRTGKRLFRDEEDAVVGGVCSGLAAYAGFQDPVWVRLIFVLLTILSFGSLSIPAYLLLWILVPAAKTAADRLAMRGEPINVDNIAKEIEDGFERLSTRVNQFGAEKKSAASDRSFNNAMSSGVSVLGQMFGFVVRFVAKFGMVIIALIAFSAFLGLAVSWVVGIWQLSTGAPFIEYVSPLSGGLTWLGFANLFFILSIPIIGLCLIFARALFKTRAPRWVGTGLGIFWTINVICFFLLASFVAKGYSKGGSVTKTIDLTNLRSDTLSVEAIVSSNTFSESFFWFDEEDGLRVSDGKIEIDDLVEIRVRRSDDGVFKCEQIIRARGSSTREAVANAEEVEYPLALNGNVLRVPTAIGIPQGKKWRGQHVRLNIEIPVGKSIVFDEKTHRHAGADLDEYTDDNDRNYISRRPGKVFRMTSKGLLCTGCPQFGDREYSSEEYYEHFILEGNFETELREGKEFKLRIDGPQGAIEKIRTGNKLTLTKKGEASGVKVYIESPVFTSLYADNTGDVTIRNFEEGDASITVKGNSRIKASSLDVSDHLNVSLSGKCSLELSGRGHQMDAILNDGATLEALNWRADGVEITASDGSKARIFAKEDALVISDSGSQVRVDGGARIRNTRYEN